MINLLQQLVEEEVLKILECKGHSPFQKTSEDTFGNVLSAAYAIHRNAHTTKTDFLIERCDSAVYHKQTSFLTDKGKSISTNHALEIFKTAFTSLGTPRHMLQHFQTNKGRIGFLSMIDKDLRSWQKGLPATERENLKRQLAKDENISAIIERGHTNTFELLTRMLFHPTTCQDIFLNAKQNSLESLFINNLQIPTYKLQDVFQMSSIITRTFTKKRSIPHRSFLIQLLPILEKKTDLLLPAPSDYAAQLFGKSPLTFFFTPKEIETFFDGDYTLNICRKRFDATLKKQLMKRQEVSEHIFDRMKECARGKDCKFHCPYQECRYHTLLQLLGSHIATYGVMRIAENMDFDNHDALLFITREREEELQLVLSNTRTDRRTSIYLFDIRKQQLADALFLISCYFESYYPQKRKLLVDNMRRFGRPFGILLCRVYRK